MKNYAFLLSASALAFTWSGAAIAQTTVVPANASQATDTPMADTPATDTAQDIVVTALRRRDKLSQTPVAASVLSGTDLANKGVVNVDALQFAMPSVTVNNFGQGNNFNVRGIGKAEHNTQTTTGVIVYRDGVPTFPGYVQGEPYYDIGNIQVLRGPQGTIVGQNATGGAVFVNTNDPIVGGEMHGYFNANYGNYNDLGGQGAINIPISDTFAARVAFYGERRDGYYDITGPTGARYDAGNNNLREIAGRISFLWKPTANFSILSKTDVGYLDFGAYPASPFANNLKFLPGTNTPNPAYRDLFDITQNTPAAARDKFVRSILKLDYAFDSGVKLRSISSYQKANTMYLADLDGNATGITSFYDSVDERQITQEFNLISPDSGRFTWLAGAFGVWNDYHFPSPYQFVIDLGVPFNNPAFQYKLQGINPTHSLAVFGQVGYAITPSLKIEAGGRYTSSKTTNRTDVLQYGTYIRDDQSAKTDNFSYKVSLGWKVSENQYLYGFVATGFRPGGLNVPVNTDTLDPFKPETITSYEAGLKSNFAGGKVHTTLTGFYNSYKNFQVIIGYPTFPTFGIELNVPNTTKIYGFEAEADAHFGHLSIDGGVSVLHSELGQFYAVDPRLPAAVDPLTGLPLPCQPASGPVSTTCINLGGRQQTYAPNLTFNVGAQYDFDVGTSGDKITPRVNFGHVGSQWATLFENPAQGDRLGDRNVLTAQLAWQHKTWTVTAYGTNLTDQHYVAALSSGLDFAGPPRQYGLKVLKIF